MSFVGREQMLTTSRDARDIRRAYENGISGYVSKEHAGSDFLELVRTMENFWHLIEAPRRGNDGT